MPNGDFCDPFSPSYDPFVCSIGDIWGPGFTGGSQAPGTTVDITVLPSPVPVIVNIPTSLGTTIASGIAGAITTSLADSNAKTKTLLDTITGIIIAGLTTLVGKLKDFVDGGQTTLSKTVDRLVTSVSQVLAGAIKTIGNDIDKVVRFVWGLASDVITALKDKIGDLIQAVKDNGAKAIIPTIGAIVTEIYNVRNVIAAIETDIKGGIGGIAQIPVALANGITSIDATLDRALQQIGFLSTAKIATDVKFPDSPIPFDFFNKIEAAFLSSGSPGDIRTIFADIQALTTSCANAKTAIDLADTARRIQGAPQWIKWLIDAFTEVTQATASLAGWLEKQVQLGEEESNRLCPIKKLDPSTAVQAVLRKYITPEHLREELRVQGYDDQRIAVLVDLASQRLDVATLFDLFYRRFISDGELASGLHSLQYTDQQIALLREQSEHLPQVTELLRWLDYKVADENFVRTSLAKLRFRPEFIDAVLSTYKTKETAQQQILLHGRLEVSGKGYVPVSFREPTPEDVNFAAARDQISEGNARLQWLAHWQLPSWLTILQGYFRNLRTLNDVHLAMEAENIPHEFWDELIRVNRPLLPFRSIPGYVRAGILNTFDAEQELAAHGFDPLHIKWILDFVNKSGKANAAGAVATAGHLSVATAKTLFDDGVITQEQYVAVLEEHKFPHDVAVLQAEAEALHAHAKTRKQQLTDLVDEVLAGLVTIDDALSVLHQNGFTVAEIARFQKSVRKASTANAKHPSIGEMKIFLKAQLITLDQFKSELQLQGWNDPWLSAFVALETP